MKEHTTSYQAAAGGVSYRDLLNVIDRQSKQIGELSFELGRLEVRAEYAQQAQAHADARLHAPHDRAAAKKHGSPGGPLALILIGSTLVTAGIARLRRVMSRTS